MSKVIYHGHSFIEIHIDQHTIYIDPFLEGNPVCDIRIEDAKCNYIILTHAHGDHMGSTGEIARKNDATVIATVELADHLTLKYGIKSHAMNIGGSYLFPFGKVKLTIAHHSSSTPDGLYAGDPAGVLISYNDKTIFHAGDTALFYDMKLIGEMNRIDHAFLPIGDNFTMGIDDAVKAAEFLNAKNIIPVHYNTFDVIKADANEFRKKIESIGKSCIVLKPGEKLSL
ncbi:MAG TPA: metal-dependent hydrolase [Ignavibacteria bacterium]|nr:metal-dependent hydrolase [Ignavibacteria bacterium]HMR40719.1 metal-dependent hydrolase [Ignavibacteria bacterium]